jgi:MoxR-like ATPase
VLPSDVSELAKDVLRHRIVLSYEGLASGVSADDILDAVLESVPVPRVELSTQTSSA